MPAYASRCSSSRVVKTATSGDRRRNERSLSSASTTINCPCPRRAPPSHAGSVPPMTTVGSSPPARSTSAAMAAVVVLPCEPATATPRFPPASCASISPRGIDAMPRCTAACRSGLSAGTALENTTTSAPSTCCAACWSAKRTPNPDSRSVTGVRRRSDPLTTQPRCTSSSAIALIPLPPTPTRWTRVPRPTVRSTVSVHPSTRAGAPSGRRPRRPRPVWPDRGSLPPARRAARHRTPAPRSAPPASCPTIPARR